MLRSTFKYSYVMYIRNVVENYENNQTRNSKRQCEKIFNRRMHTKIDLSSFLMLPIEKVIIIIMIDRIVASD